jgi:tRNA(Ile)-lysidine synthase
MNTLYPLFLEHIENYHLISDLDTVILGFSGGKDSVTLFYLLKELRERQDVYFSLVVAYFNHRLRSDASQEQQWIEDFCRRHQTEPVIGGKDVKAFKDSHKLNLEHAASISRYRFFQEVSAHFENAKVATAHTQSDLTETFFIKLFRGSGLQGLSTIYHKKENTIIRPLLLFPQEEILAFLERNKIKYYEDYTNQQDEFLRNRIRHHVVPEIKKIEPNIHKHIFKTVSIIQAEYDYFSDSARDILAKELLAGKVLPAKILTNYHIAVQRHIVREYIRMLKGNLLNIDFRHIEAVRTRHGETGGLAIPGIELTFHKGFIFPHGFSIPAYSYSLPHPGILNISETGQTVTFQTTEAFEKPGDNYHIIVPASLLKFPLTVRSPGREDKYVKINTKINQKVIEMIRASGIPSELRNLCPVLVNGDGAIIWVAGAPVAHPFRVTAGAKGPFMDISMFKRPGN